MIAEFRHAHSGEWLLVLVPTALLLTAKVSTFYLLQLAILFLAFSRASEKASLLIICILTWTNWSNFHSLCLTTSTFLVISSLMAYKRIFVNFKKAWNGEDNILILLSFLVLYLKTNIFQGFVGAFAIYQFNDKLPKIFTEFPRSFTFGEGCVVFQGITLFIIHAGTSMMTDDVTSIKGTFDVTGKICLMSVAVLLIIPSLKMCEWAKSSTYFLAYGMAFFLSITYPLLWYRLKRNPILWMVNYVVSTKVMGLVMVWIFLVAMAVIFLVARKSKATTSVRKMFHLFAVLVAISGILVDPQFTSFSSLIVLGVFLLLEFIRSFKVEPASEILDRLFDIFVDEKDEGFFVLTNIYLLIGIFFPFWINDDLNEGIVLLSGVLSIGIGDSAASLIGSNYGHYKIPGQQKTVEGTLASVISQSVAVMIFNHFQVVQVNVVSYLPAICVVSLIEAFTSQVDNLILPLMLFIMNKLII